jgi:hypothetical protein
VQKALDIIELKLRPESFAEPTPQLLQYAPCALHVDLARHFHRRVVTIIAAAQGTPERVGILLRSGRAKSPRTAVRARTEHPLLLHGLREILSAPAERLERAAL